MYTFLKKSTVLVASICFSSGLFAQEIAPTETLPTHSKLVKGQLSNGLTYYIYPTKVVKNTASFYIMQKVGSILENDKQKGLAHFLEHMAFNGTKNFPEKTMLTRLEKEGAIFGKNINAYTSYDETIYNLDNISVTKPENIDLCLTILHDWSSFLTLSDKEIDAERGVIQEEWRTRQNANQRIQETFAPFIYNKSAYAYRSPIGDMEIVKNFPYKDLRDYYKDWYRPDLQAIVVVGDIDVKTIENKIKTIYADIKLPKNPKKRFTVDRPDHTETYYKMAMDKEISQSRISMYFFHKAKPKTNTFAEFKQNMLRQMVYSILQNRLSEEAKKTDAPLKGSYIGYDNYLSNMDALTFSVVPKPNKQVESFQILANEWFRIMRFGVTANEIKRSAESTKNWYERAIESEEEQSQGEIIGGIKSNFLKNSTYSTLQTTQKWALKVLETVTSKDLQDILQQHFIPNNRVITVTGLENEQNISKEQIETILKNTENNPDLKPYQDDFVEKSLLTDVTIKAGKIVSEKNETEIQATTIKLSNGVVVHYKFADKNKKEISLKAESYGGSSLCATDDLPSANIAVNLTNMSGVGAFTQTELSKNMTGKNASASSYISALTEGYQASGNVKDLETMFQLLHIKITKPRFDVEKFKQIKESLQNALANKDKNLNSRISDSLTVALYGKNNPKMPLLSQETIDKIAFEKAKNFYLDRFKDINNFEFFIVGDVSLEVLRPLLEKYIASIPAVERKETYKNNRVAWVSNSIKKDIYIPMQIPKANVRINFEKSTTYSLRNNYLASILGDILKLRFTESLREKEGGTYGAGVSCYAVKKPESYNTLSIQFDCDAARADQLVPIVYQELEKIKNGEIVAEDLEKTKKNYLKSREDRKNYNSYSMDLLQRFYTENYNPEKPENFENILQSIGAKDIQQFANDFLTNAKSYQIIFRPKS